LIGCFRGDKKFVYTPLLKWYLAHGLQVTQIYKRIKATRGRPFAEFRDWVTSERSKADECKDGSLEARGLGAKMVGNAAVGGSMMDKTRHSQTRMTSDIKQVLRYHNDPRFKSTTLLTLQNMDDHSVSKLYEITRGKQTIRQDRPLQIGVAVYDLAKMRMLQFYYEFLDRFLSRDDFQMLEMDTDSNYLALTDDSLEKLVRPELRSLFEQEKHLWLSDTEDGKKDRTPGLFKVEFAGSRMVCLAPKSYFADRGANSNRECEACSLLVSGRCKEHADEAHISSKGVSKKTNALTFDLYKRALDTNVSVESVNHGFRVASDLSVVTYAQRKCGLSSRYTKRKVLNDGVTTVPLDV